MEKLVDKDVARTWCSGDKALVERLWRSFYQQFAQTPDHLGPGAAQDLAHNLKNLAPYCGAITLGAIAQQYAPPAPPPSQAQTAILLSHLREVLSALEVHLPGLGQPAAETREVQTFKRLTHLLQTHNFKVLAAFDEWTAEFALDWPHESIDDIGRALHAFEFKEAQGLLRGAYLAHGRYPAHIE